MPQIIAHEDDIADALETINGIQHVENLQNLVNVCFHRAGVLARLALAAGDLPRRQKCSDFADKLQQALDENQPARMLTITGAASLLGVSEQTISRRIKAGTLPAFKLAGTQGGGRETILIDQADVLRLLEPYAGPEANQ